MASETSSSSNSSIRRTHGGRRRVEDASDRISGLPDAVLSHILSFLLTDEAVGTGILSKRWRYVWTSVPTIDITDNPWVEGRQKYRYDANEFMDFVDSVLRLNDAPCLKSFRLFCEGDYDLSRISDWISSVALHRVEKIELRFDGSNHLRLPLSIFTCNKIVSLKLWQKILVNVPKLVYFPRLKIIELVSMQVLDVDDMKNLLAGSPALEELNIDPRFSDHQPYTLHVRSSSLKSLNFVTDDYSSDDDEGIVIDAPNLQHLTLTVYVTVQIDMNYLSSLITATLGLCRDEGYSARVGTNIHSRVTDLLQKISNTEYLCLSLDTMECLEHEGLDNFPIFHNLNHLVVLNYKHSSRGLSTLLECSPNLISLVLEMSCVSRGDLYECFSQLCPLKCCMLYLEKIELRGFKGTSTEMELVRQLLVNATVLKKMSIRCYSSSFKDKEELQIVKKLLMFPRGSTRCQIEFTDMYTQSCVT